MSDPTDVPAPQLSLSTFQQDDAIVVQCTGKLVAGVADILQDEVKRLIPQTKRIIIDPSDVTHMDSPQFGRPR